MDKWEWLSRHYMAPDEVELAERRYGPALGGVEVTKWEWVTRHYLSPDEVDVAEHRWEIREACEREAAKTVTPRPATTSHSMMATWARGTDLESICDLFLRLVAFVEAPEDTKAEPVIRRLLWSRGLRYRKHPKSIPGRPDIAFISRRVAVLCFGEDSRRPNNMVRLYLAERALHELGWLVVRLWDHETLADPEAGYMKVTDALKARGARVPPPA